MNRQTGQWGTQYDATQELAQAALLTDPLSEEVERFTTSIASRGQDGEVRFDWDRTRWRAPFTVK